MVTDTRGLRSGLVLSGVALIATCYGFARFGYGLFGSVIADEFSLSASLTGVIGAGSYVGYCMAIGLSTVLTMRWGPRPVAVVAGIVATLGITVVAAAPTPALLAVGVLVAGSSTGIASPPLAAAVARWVRDGVRDTAQTLVNAGTGIGVLVSGPLALVLLDQWRLAWALFAVVAAGVTAWVAASIPSGAHRNDDGGDRAVGVWAEGAWGLVLASFVMGLSSVAVWTFGQEVIGAHSAVSWLAPVTWTVIGAAGFAGAFAGPIVGRMGIRRSWGLLMVLLAVGTAGLAGGAGLPAAVLGAAALFGASYIALTGVILVWATRTYDTRPALGVGLAFFMVAVGQAVGAPLVGLGADSLSLPVVFFACAVVAVVGALVPGRPTPRQGQTTHDQVEPCQ